MTSRRPVILFDIDGTVADLSHRLHFITGGSNDWPSFNKNIPFDKPIAQTILLNALFKQGLHPAFGIIFASGRSEDERAMTETWLDKHKVFRDKLYMRKAGDMRADYVIKREILDDIRADGYEPFMVIDDRQSVVDMWRANGLFVLQCDPKGAECRSDVYRFHKDIEYPLTIMVGPSGAGKSTWLRDYYSKTFLDGAGLGSVLSSDILRKQICGDFNDMTKNNRVFAAMHELAEHRLKLGLPVILDATHIRNKDRIASVKCLPDDFPVQYIVINRSLEEKLKTRGARSEELVRRHDQIFNSNLKDILAGDGLPNVTVKDLRK